MRLKNGRAPAERLYCSDVNKGILVDWIFKEFYFIKYCVLGCKSAPMMGAQGQERFHFYKVLNRCKTPSPSCSF